MCAIYVLIEMKVVGGNMSFVSYNHYFTLERDDETGECIEYELQVECEITPFTPGKLSGPMDKCYPDEGGYAEIVGPVFQLNDDGKKTPWGGVLSKEEESNILEAAYNKWTEEDDRDFEPDYDNFEADNDDFCSVHCSDYDR